MSFFCQTVFLAPDCCETLSERMKDADQLTPALKIPVQLQVKVSQLKRCKKKKIIRN